MPEEEKSICTKLIRNTLDRRLLITVRDYEEGDVFLRHSSNPIEIAQATAATCGTLYDVVIHHRETYTRLGTIVLIHGNGEDVISDLSWPAAHPEYEIILDYLVDFN